MPERFSYKTQDVVGSFRLFNASVWELRDSCMFSEEAEIPNQVWGEVSGDMSMDRTQTFWANAVFQTEVSGLRVMYETPHFRSAFPGIAPLLNPEEGENYIAAINAETILFNPPRNDMDFGWYFYDKQGQVAVIRHDIEEFVAYQPTTAFLRIDEDNWHVIRYTGDGAMDHYVKGEVADFEHGPEYRHSIGTIKNGEEKVIDELVYRIDADRENNRLTHTVKTASGHRQKIVEIPYQVDPTHFKTLITGPVWPAVLREFPVGVKLV